MTSTYVHVDHLPIALLPAYDGGHQYKSIFRDKIPYASLISVGVAGVRLEVEFQGGGKGEEGEGE